MHTRWPRIDDWPPEEDCRTEKTNVFEVVPAFVLEREVVGSRDVPSEENEVHCEPGNQRRCEEMSKPAKRVAGSAGEIGFVSQSFVWTGAEGRRDELVRGHGEGNRGETMVRGSRRVLRFRFTSAPPGLRVADA